MSDLTALAPESPVRPHPLQDQLASHIRAAAARNLPMVQPGQYERSRSPGVVIAGTGATLMKITTIEKLRKLAAKKWTIMACKEAARLLQQARIPVHYCVAIDPKPDQVAKLPLLKDVTYLLASVCHPLSFDHLLQAGRPVRVFHSASGARDPESGHSEDELYALLFPVAEAVGGGHSVVNRAVELAYWMGFRRFLVAGAPFGWRDGWSYYAAGTTGRPGNDQGFVYTDDGNLDGRPWFTRLDQMLSALHVAMVQHRGHHLQFQGDSLAKALAKNLPTILKLGQAWKGQIFRPLDTPAANFKAA